MQLHLPRPIQQPPWRRREAIADPWFRSQAIAWIARFAAAAEVTPILKEARESSWVAEDKYKIVGSSAWRMRAMIERGEQQAAADELPDLLKSAADINHPVSRLEALFLLFQSVFEVDNCRRIVLDALLEACHDAKSWKSGDRLRETAIMLAFAGHHDQASEVIGAMPTGRFRRQAIERIERGQRREHRPFCW